MAIGLRLNRAIGASVVWRTGDRPLGLDGLAPVYRHPFPPDGGWQVRWHRIEFPHVEVDAPIEDPELAGMIRWVLPGLVYLAAMLALLAAWPPAVERGAWRAGEQCGAEPV
jgi:hypothetical protein